MLLILETILTVVAWRKGRRGFALLPVGITVIFGFLLGAAVQASGGNIQAATPVVLVADLVCTGILIAMASRAPRRVQAPGMVEVTLPTEVTTDRAKA